MRTIDQDELFNKALRNRLSDAERERWDQLLRSDPILREDFAEETALERVLDALPNAPLSSNFTSLVLQAAQRETPARPGWRMRWPVWRWAPAAAVFLLLCSAGLLGYRQHAIQRQEMAANVRSFSEFAAAVTLKETGPEEVFQNFDAIQRLSFPAEGELDMDLLVALQK